MHITREKASDLLNRIYNYYNTISTLVRIQSMFFRYLIGKDDVRNSFLGVRSRNEYIFYVDWSFNSSTIDYFYRTVVLILL